MIKLETRRKRIQAKMSKLYAELLTLQDSCEHLNAFGMYQANDGNYDPSCDSYWLECRCPECGKRWHIDSKKNDKEYRFFDCVGNRKIIHQYNAKNDWPDSVK